MNANKPFLDPAQDTDVAWARRKETTLAALKMFRVALDAVRRHAEWVETRHGLSATELWVLWELARTPGLRAVDLAKNMALPRSSTDPLLENLVNRNLLRRHAEEGGPMLYFPTQEGQRIADTSPQHGQGVLKTGMDQMSDAALAQLVQAMASLVPHLPFVEERAAFKPMSDLLRPAEAGKRNGTKASKP